MLLMLLLVVYQTTKRTPTSTLSTSPFLPTRRHVAKARAHAAPRRAARRPLTPGASLARDPHATVFRINAQDTRTGAVDNLIDNRMRLQSMMNAKSDAERKALSGLLGGGGGGSSGGF